MSNPTDDELNRAIAQAANMTFHPNEDRSVWYVLVGKDFEVWDPLTNPIQLAMAQDRIRRKGWAWKANNAREFGIAVHTMLQQERA